ncbi:MAK10-like protein [Tanacetum coccineum]
MCSKLDHYGDLVLHLTLYHSLAGALHYLTFTRPDFSYVVQHVCRYMHAPREPHFYALKRIIRYVRGTLDYGLQLHISNTVKLTAYMNAEWGYMHLNCEEVIHVLNLFKEWGNRLEQGMEHKPVIVEVFYDLRGDYRVVYHDPCLGRPTAKGVGLCMASSHNGNHREDDFTPLETIRMFLDTIGRLKSFWEHSPKKPKIYHRGKEMDFRSFMVGGIDGEFHFKPEGGFADGEGNSLSNRSVNNEASVIDVAPLNFAPPSHVPENIGDSNDVSSGGDIIREVKRLHKSSKITVVDDASDPLDVDIDPGIHEFPSAKELKDFTDCHFVVAHVTPPPWKHHLRDISLEKLYDIHDRTDTRHAILDNILNSQTRQLMSALEKVRASCDAIRERENKKDKAYAELERKCNEALLMGFTVSTTDLCLKRKNGLIIRKPCPCFAPKLKDLNLRVRLKNFETQLLQDIDSLKQDQATVVSKVDPDMATKLIRSDKMDFLIVKLVKSAMFQGRCAAFKEVASLKEPFILEKMPGYRSSSKEEFDRASDGLANASYPFPAEVTVDPYASVDKLLSKKLQSLHSKPASSCSNPLSFEGSSYVKISM